MHGDAGIELIGSNVGVDGEVLDVGLVVAAGDVAPEARVTAAPMETGDGSETKLPVAAKVELHLNGHDDIARQQSALAIGHGTVDKVVGLGGLVEMDVTAVELVFVPLQAEAG